ncbi:MAG: hypothetical protein K1X55_02905 [Chitinophagales bacterium]|nr:hypothetical protein [Chitinophagales bacterium]
MTKFYFSLLLFIISSFVYGQSPRINLGSATSNEKELKQTKPVNVQEHVNKPDASNTPTSEGSAQRMGASLEQSLPKTEKIDSSASQTSAPVNPNIFSGMECNVTYEKVEPTLQISNSVKEATPIKVTKSVNYKEQTLKEDNVNKVILTSEAVSPGKRVYLQQYLEALEAEIAQNKDNPSYNLSEKEAERNQLKKLLEP